MMVEEKQVWGVKKKLSVPYRDAAEKEREWRGKASPYLNPRESF